MAVVLCDLYTYWPQSLGAISMQVGQNKSHSSRLQEICCGPRSEHNMNSSCNRRYEIDKTPSYVRLIFVGISICKHYVFMTTQHIHLFSYCFIRLYGELCITHKQASYTYKMVLYHQNVDQIKCILLLPSRAFQAYVQDMFFSTQPVDSERSKSLRAQS